MSNNKDKMVMQKEVVQAVVIADNFGNGFMPLTSDSPFALLPLVNTPLIDYTLEFLSLGGIEETFLFCCSNFDAIKEHIRNGIKKFAGWSLTMKVNVIISESCRSLGDCLRDLDAKGLIRNDFVLIEPGCVGNIKLLPFIKKHSEICKNDKGAAMTVLMQEAGIGQRGRCVLEELLIVSAPNNRILFHKKLGTSRSRRVNLPLEILVDNPAVNIVHNLRDTHIAICSPSVLPLFSDNFDFQTRDDFVRGLLMNEEILGSTVYYDTIKGNEYGAAVTNWRMYQAISYDIMHRWTYPLVPDIGISTQETDYVHMRNNIYRNKNTHLAKDSNLVEDVTIGYGSSVSDNSRVVRTVIGDNVKIGGNVDIMDSFIMSGTTVEDECIIAYSVIGPNCTIKKKSTITNGCILGKEVVIPSKTSIEDCLVQSGHSKGVMEKLGDRAYKLKQGDDDADFENEEDGLVRQVSRLHVDKKYVEESEDEGDDFSVTNEDESYRNSPVPDDTNLFLMEVMESLKRGFEDKLSCDNLILEINSSRYAYNVTVKEVNFHVVKAILTLPFQLFVGQRYLPSLQRLLSYFSSILKNYIRNEAAMEDCLHAVEEVATNNNELHECISAVLHWLYEKDYLSEERILTWFSSISRETRLYVKLKPFATWLEQAEEESSENDI